MKKILCILLILFLLAGCATEIVSHCQNCGKVIHYFNRELGDEVSCPSCQATFILSNYIWRAE